MVVAKETVDHPWAGFYVQEASVTDGVVSDHPGAQTEAFNMAHDALHRPNSGSVLQRDEEFILDDVRSGSDP